MKPSEILSLWPDLGVLASDIGRPYHTVAAWRRRNSIPIPYWGPIAASARARGIAVTEEMLLVAAQQVEAGASQQRK